MIVLQIIGNCGHVLQVYNVTVHDVYRTLTVTTNMAAGGAVTQLVCSQAEASKSLVTTQVGGIPLPISVVTQDGYYFAV